MIRNLLKGLAPALLGLVLSGPAVAGPVIVTTRPGFAPPPPPRPVVVVQPARPAPAYQWIEGQWAWTGYQWTWIQGYWAPQPVQYVAAPTYRPVYAPVYRAAPPRAPYPVRPARPVVVMR